jgi:hypothetical protein
MRGYGQLGICTQPYEQLSQADSLVIPCLLSGHKQYVDVTNNQILYIGLVWLYLGFVQFCLHLPQLRLKNRFQM